MKYSEKDRNLKIQKVRPKAKRPKNNNNNNNITTQPMTMPQAAGNKRLVKIQANYSKTQ